MSRRANRHTKPGNKPGRRWYLRAIWVCLFLGLAFLIVYWQRHNLTNLAEDIWRAFGWGLLVLATVIIFVISTIVRHRILVTFRKGYLWLGAVAFLAAVWGLLGWIDLGGNFGLAIIGAPGALGALRLLGLVLLGTFLVAPRTWCRLIKQCWVGMLWRIGEKRADGKAKVIVPVTESAMPAVREQKAKKIAPEKEPATAAGESKPAARDLRQVAQDVWKKYGEAPDLVQVDGWRLPPVEILDKIAEVEFSEADNLKRARLIEEALASYGVETKVVQINAGPTVTQFGLEPGWDRKMREVREKDKDGNTKVKEEEVSKTRVKVDRITSLSNDIALALAAPSIRMEAPVPGKSIVGIEVPNKTTGVVGLRSVIETGAFQKTKAKSKLALALGKGAGGEAVAGDLAKMPHLLIAGATGSGKTVCLNTIISCLLLHNAPTEIKFIMVDPKRVELTPYNSIPHLAAPVIVDANKAVGALRWLNQEMDRRYHTLAAAGARNIEGYNKDHEGATRLPYIVLVIDELADLMMAGFAEVEHILCRLAQLARAVGIHLVVATQRPSVDVVTGLIKANFPTRVSFAVTSQVDSRTILDMGGAEKLLGKGDMLYMPTEEAKPKRLQGCFMSDTEMERLVYFWSSQRKGEMSSIVIEDVAPPAGPGHREPPSDDPMMEEVRKLAEEHGNISASFLQRRLRIGYPRAARLMEQFAAENPEAMAEDEPEKENGG
jgi:S-DNA-T family DNA segregation ATPase FtsK/SpoIIIE